VTVVAGSSHFDYPEVASAAPPHFVAAEQLVDGHEPVLSFADYGPAVARLEDVAGPFVLVVVAAAAAAVGASAALALVYYSVLSYERSELG